MDFSLSAEQAAIRSAIERICARFDDDYWLANRDGGFPQDFHRTFADDGWLGMLSAVPLFSLFSGAGKSRAPRRKPSTSIRFTN
jgi:acyl-CoA dehydrogenase